MKRRLKGTVVSDKMNQTAVVAVEHLRKHPRYEKYFKITTRLKAHNADNQFKIGDGVVIEETRPISKEKRWKIVERIAKKEASLKQEEKEQI